MGCRDGFLAMQLAGRGSKVTRIDCSDVAISKAPENSGSRKYPNVEFLQAFSESTPFEHQPFDVLVCCHTPEYVKILEKGALSLKPLCTKAVITIAPIQLLAQYGGDYHVQSFTPLENLEKAMKAKASSRLVHPRQEHDAKHIITRFDCDMTSA